MKRNYLGLSPVQDEGYTYVVVGASSLWSGLFFGLQICAMMLTQEWKASLGLPFTTASTHQIMMTVTRYAATILTSGLRFGRF